MLLDKHPLFVISCWCWFRISSAFNPMVSFHGHTRVALAARRTMGGGIHHVSERPPDPKTLLDAAALEERVQTVRLETLYYYLSSKSLLYFICLVLAHTRISCICFVSSWIGGKGKSPSFVLRVPGCRPIRGFQTVSSKWLVCHICFCACHCSSLFFVVAMHTDRGSNGSYHRGHKPIIHQQFMDSDYQRQRYWGRSMVGWSKFDSAQPNVSTILIARSNVDVCRKKRLTRMSFGIFRRGTLLWPSWKVWGSSE